MRLIDADELRERVEYIEYEFGHINEDINDMPTIDAVEVVRCKDCKWWDKKWGCETFGFVRTNMENFYCADGETDDSVVKDSLTTEKAMCKKCTLEEVEK